MRCVHGLNPPWFGVKQFTQDLAKAVAAVADGQQFQGVVLDAPCASRVAMASAAWRAVSVPLNLSGAMRTCMARV